MNGPVITPAEPGPATLLSGIADDARELLKQQLHLFKAEMRQDVAKAKTAALLVLAGTGVSLLAALLLGLMLVYLFEWLVPSVPFWIGYGIVGLLLVVVGAVLVVLTAQHLKTSPPLPEQSVAALKENVQWQTAPR